MFSDHTKLITEYAENKQRIIKENMAMLNHVLDIKEELIEASRIYLIRTNPSEFVEMLFVGPDSLNKRRTEQAPDFLKQSDLICDYVTKSIQARIERGFNSVNTDIFEESFYQTLDDELLIKFGISMDHFIGYSLKQIDLE